MAQTVETIKPVSPAVVVDPIPQFDGSKFPSCLYPSILGGFNPGCGSVPFSAFDQDRNRLTREVREAVGGRAVFLNTSGVLCDDECHALADGRMQYRDAAHLNVRGAMRFEQQLEAALRSAIDDGGMSRVARGRHG